MREQVERLRHLLLDARRGDDVQGGESVGGGVEEGMEGVGWGVVWSGAGCGGSLLCPGGVGGFVVAVEVGRDW